MCKDACLLLLYLYRGGRGGYSERYLLYDNGYAFRQALLQPCFAIFRELREIKALIFPAHGISWKR